MAATALDTFRQWKADGTLPLLSLPGARDDLALLKPHAARFAKFEHVIVLGTGGSSLGGQTLVALKDQGFGPLQGHPKLWFMDNVDPSTFTELAARLPLARTGLIVISKSGTTAETLTQFTAARVLRLLRVWARQPWRRFCIFAALTHPSSYTFLSHYAPVIWPHATRKEIPPHIMQRMEHLAETFHLERVDPADPLVRHVNWVTLESEEDRKRWMASKRRDTRFYLDHNPGYVEGHGMLTYIPFNGAILLRSLVRFLVGRAGKITRLLLGKDGGPKAPRRHPIDSAFQPLESSLPRDARR